MKIFFACPSYSTRTDFLRVAQDFLRVSSIFLFAYDGKLHKKIAMVFLYHFIWIAIEMLLGYTIMSIVKGNDYANFELLCSIICKIIMLALVKIIPCLMIVFGVV